MTSDPKPSPPPESVTHGDLRRVLIGGAIGAVLGAIAGVFIGNTFSMAIAGTVAGVAIAFVGAIRRDQRLRRAQLEPRHEDPRRPKKRKRKH